MLAIRILLTITTVLLSFYCYVYWNHLNNAEAENDFKNEHPIIYFFAEYLIFLLAISLIIFFHDCIERF